MALASRLLSRSTRQLCAGQVVLRPEHAVPVRSFAKEAAAPTALKGDQVLEDSFYKLQKKLETLIGLPRKEKITIDPEDPAAVSEYAKVMKSVRQKRGLVDSQGIEDLQMAALDKVEKEIKKPLMRNDKKGIALLTAEFDKINQKFGIRKEDLPKYEEQLELKIAKAQLELKIAKAQLELKIAKAQLEELKKDALEAMETQKKREEFKDEEMPSVKLWTSETSFEK